MDKYYYFLSELPFLKFGQRPQIKKKEFIEEASKWLSEKDLCSLCDTSSNNFYIRNNKIAAIREYQRFEKQLREELVLYRKGAQKDKNKKTQILNSSSIEGNPLEVEKKLLLSRWKFIEEREAGNNFNFTMVSLYFLKLQILERLSTFNKAKGKITFKALCKVRT